MDDYVLGELTPDLRLRASSRRPVDNDSVKVRPPISAGSGSYDPHVFAPTMAAAEALHYSDVI
jgi:hypothetical protein